MVLAVATVAFFSGSVNGSQCKRVLSFLRGVAAAVASADTVGFDTVANGASDAATGSNILEGPQQQFGEDVSKKKERNSATMMMMVG
jgi:hypothetical protein